MNKIKSFKVFESGLRYTYTQDIQISINELFSEERFLPHINQENQWTGGMRKFNIGVIANESKWGIQYEVSFRTSDVVDLELVNEEIKHSWRDIMDIIMDKAKVNGQLKITKFNYFGHKGEGRKNGHTMQIEDVTNELVDAIDQDTELEKSFSPISITFTVTN